MPSTTRRRLLAAVGGATLGATAGCASIDIDDEPPAGSLRFVNNHDVPHAIRMRVVEVGTAYGDAPGTVTGTPVLPPEQRTLTASTVVRPGETETYPGAFEYPAYYAVQFTIDGRRPETGGRTAFHPAPSADRRGTYLTGRVSVGGELSWLISTTDHTGPFDA